MPAKPSVVTALASALMAGAPDVDAAIGRCHHTLGRPWRWVRTLVRRYVDAFEGATRPRRRDVIAFLLADDSFREAASRYGHQLRVETYLQQPQRMLPVAAAESWPLPAIETVGDLAKWLSVSVPELEWLADRKGLNRRNGSPLLRHYHYRVLEKAGGASRLIEAPKPMLKQAQRRILDEILNRIPPHAAAHGFLPGRSIKTFAAPHVGRRVVLRLDLRDFFPSIPAARIEALFRTVGCPDSVSQLLAGLCTTSAPHELCKPGLEIYRHRHLPQGAPTSPALANLCAYRADCRLAGLATAAGARYTRYADDLAFSGGEDFERRVSRFSAHAAAILLEEGFHVHHRKTRVMRQGVRQHLAGLVTNAKLNVCRTDFDLLKATLTNCVRHGPQDQNRAGHADFRAHLEGRIGFVAMINPARGARLRVIFDQIRWNGTIFP